MLGTPPAKLNYPIRNVLNAWKMQNQPHVEINTRVRSLAFLQTKLTFSEQGLLLELHQQQINSFVSTNVVGAGSAFHLDKT